MLPATSCIRASLPASVLARVRTLEVMEEVDSTNDLLAEELPVSGQRIRLARLQKSGRGRQGRDWVTASDGLCFSVLHAHIGRPPKSPSLWVGIALAQCLHSQGFPGVRLCWPNDLVAEGKKLGGILLEGRSLGDRYWSVAGVGINLESVPTVDRPATSLLHACGQRPDCEHLVPVLIASVSDALAGACAQQSEALSAAYARYDALQDQEVCVEEPHGVHVGIARGIDDAGHLRVESQGGLRVFSAGDVRLRRQ